MPDQTPLYLDRYKDSIFYMHPLLRLLILFCIIPIVALVQITPDMNALGIWLVTNKVGILLILFLAVLLAILEWQVDKDA